MADGDVAPRLPRAFRGVGDEAGERRFGEVEVLWPRAGRQRRRRRGADPRVLVGEHRPRERCRVLVADRAERGDRPGADRGIGIARAAAGCSAPSGASVSLRDSASDRSARARTFGDS